MEYIFGNAIYNGEIVDILKTVGSEHTNLTGQQSIERKYPDNIITDTFKVVEKYLSKEDSEGQCYDWYRITDHYRMMDTFTPGKKDLEDAIEENSNGEFDLADIADENNNAIMDLADYVAEMEERLAVLEGGN